MYVFCCSGGVDMVMALIGECEFVSRVFVGVVDIVDVL